MSDLSHVDEHGRPRMVDVGDKIKSLRLARAEGFIELLPQTIALIQNGEVRKGNVLTTAELAGVMAAKQTSNLIPLCHPLLLSKVHVEARCEKNGVRVTAEVRCEGQTGVEMEALTGVSVALLTVYDMCKAVDKTMKMSGIYLIEKTKKECV